MRRIFISAGHSSTDPGAVAFGRTEASIALEFRDLVAFYLKELGANFECDGVKGENKTLREAVKMIRPGDLAVEFHLNAGVATATGVETLSSQVDFPFCSKLCATISQCLGLRNRGAKPEYSGQHARLAFIQAGGIICELFFLSNSNDLAAYDAKKWLLAKDVAHLLYNEVKHA